MTHDAQQGMLFGSLDTTPETGRHTRAGAEATAQLRLCTLNPDGRARLAGREVLGGPSEARTGPHRVLRLTRSSTFTPRSGNDAA